MKRLLVALGALSVVASNSYAAVTVSSDTDTGGWNSVGGNYDYLVDQQTGQPSSDIVGGVGGAYNAYDAGFFTNWDAGTASSTDGTLGFRVRLDDKDTNQGTYKGVLWIGVDADIDGDIDAFMGVDNQGSSQTLGIYAPGSGLNNSPNTTTISSTAATSYTVSSSNYNYRAVTAADGGTTLDITTANSGDTDYYLSFTINFADVVSFLNGNGISITDASPLRYVLGTATQHNSLNQDLGNVNGNVNSSITWEQLGGFSPTMNATGTVVPEPTAALLGGLGLLALFRRRRN